MLEKILHFLLITMAFIIHKKLSLSKARTCIGIFIFTYTCWIKSVWTLYLYYFSHFSHGTLFARSKQELPAASIDKIYAGMTLYFFFLPNNPKCCVSGQSFTVAQGTSSMLLFTAQSWLMTVLTESGKSAYSREWTQKVIGKIL